MINLNFKYKEIINKLTELFPEKPDIAIILGSGLGDFAGSIRVKNAISTSSLPGYPASTIKGHEGKIIHGEYEGRKILMFQGRIHFYEGYLLSQCILPVFITSKMGIEKILFTNAAGGISENLMPGDLMLTTSFNGISIKKELTDLIGLPDTNEKNNFLDFPSASFNDIIIKAAVTEHIELKNGVYWYTKGPSYETPAEIRMIKKFGGDAVGMSTVHEAIFAAFIGLKAASISCVTNYAAGISNKKLNHAEVTETANLVKDKFERLVKRVITSI